MKTSLVADPPAKEGLRARKRRQTRERIITAALRLFLDRGFDAVTIDEIADAADISKRSFFDYFPAKEDVIFSWQDAFGHALAAAVSARPSNEPLTRTVQEALIATLAASSQPESVALDELIQRTPALQKRDSVKYAKLEETLTNALVGRTQGQRERFRAQLLAAIITAGIKLASAEWRRSGKSASSQGNSFTKKMFHQVWTDLYQLGLMALKDTGTSPRRKRV